MAIRDSWWEDEATGSKNPTLDAMIFSERGILVEEKAVRVELFAVYQTSV